MNRSAPLPPPDPVPDPPSSSPAHLTRRLAPLSEVARLLGADRLRLYDLARRTKFPAPAAHAAKLPVYDIDEVAAFLNLTPPPRL